MKKAIILALCLVVLAGVFAISRCSLSGPIVTEKKDFTGFTRVDVEGAFDVEVAQSGVFSVTVNTYKDLLDYIAVSLEKDTLKIALSPRHPFTVFDFQSKKVRVKVTMPAISGFQLSGASKGTISKFKSSEEFSVTVSGASSLDIKGIESGTASIEVSGASKVTGDIVAGSVTLEVSGASTVKLDGSADDVTLDASGASKADLAGFPHQNADASLSGASEATLDVRGRLNVVLSAASKLYFLGNPTIGNINVSGASTIKHK